MQETEALALAEWALPETCSCVRLAFGRLSSGFRPVALSTAATLGCTLNREALGGALTHRRRCRKTLR